MFRAINTVETFILISFLIAGSGCALTQEKVKLSYIPQVDAKKVERADSSTVTVEVTDSRTVKDRVGSKHNAYGIEMAAITSEEDVPLLLKKSIESELGNRGFRIGAHKAQVAVELVKLENDFKFGLLSADAVAELLMQVRVKEPAGRVLYSKSIQGKGLNNGCGDWCGLRLPRGNRCDDGLHVECSANSESSQSPVKRSYEQLQSQSLPHAWNSSIERKLRRHV